MASVRSSHFLSSSFTLLLLLLPSITMALSYGTCTDPTIVYVHSGEDVILHGFRPHNLVDFPHSYSHEIATIESYICARLDTYCHAPEDTLTACSQAYAADSLFAGQHAADLWNQAMMPSSSTTGVVNVVPVLTAVMETSTLPSGKETTFKVLKTVYSTVIMASAESGASSVSTVVSDPSTSTFLFTASQTVTDPPTSATMTSDPSASMQSVAAGFSFRTHDNTAFGGLLFLSWTFAVAAGAILLGLMM